MKKIFAILVAAIAATTILICSAVAVVTSGDTSNGTVRFESAETPSLNFTMPVSRVADIFRLMPESVTTVCRQEYAAVRSKCARSASFTHEGVSVKVAGNDPGLQFVFTIPGYTLTVNDVSWQTLDAMFADSNL